MRQSKWEVVEPPGEGCGKAPRGEGSHTRGLIGYQGRLLLRLPRGRTASAARSLSADKIETGRQRWPQPFGMRRLPSLCEQDDGRSGCRDEDNIH